MIAKIEDSRFIYFGKRLIYQNHPESLPKKEYEEIHVDIATAYRYELHILKRKTLVDMSELAVDLAKTISMFVS